MQIKISGEQVSGSSFSEELTLCLKNPLENEICFISSGLPLNFEINGNLNLAVGMQNVLLLQLLQIWQRETNPHQTCTMTLQKSGYFHRYCMFAFFYSLVHWIPHLCIDISVYSNEYCEVECVKVIWFKLHVWLKYL